jgi:HK97 gp10 family phage protein
MAETTVHGMADLHKLLQRLPVKVETNVLRGAVRAGQNVIKKAAQSAAPADTGELRKSIRVTSSRRALKRGFVRADVVAGNATAWYAHIIEFGSGQFYEGTGRSVRKPYVIRAKVADGKEASTGQKRRALRVGSALVAQVTHPGVKPRRFMRTAAQQLEGPALDAFVAYVRKRLPIEAAKNA